MNPQTRLKSGGVFAPGLVFLKVLNGNWREEFLAYISALQSSLNWIRRWCLVLGKEKDYHKMLTRDPCFQRVGPGPYECPSVDEQTRKMRRNIFPPCSPTSDPSFPQSLDHGLQQSIWAIYFCQAEGPIRKLLNRCAFNNFSSRRPDETRHNLPAISFTAMHDARSSFASASATPTLEVCGRVFSTSSLPLIDPS